jgi:HD-GYP domain-containing protein (c-di-GMP phosphodiesterase class II)
MSALLALSDAIEARDPYMRGHSVRVAQMALEVGVRLGCDNGRLGLLHLGGALHDVGKFVVAEAILAKPGPLTEAEFAQIREHPEAGARLVALDRGLRAAFPGVLFHHERLDGGGYPTGCAGAQIPLEARILAVVDCYDAMTSDRAYRSALRAEDAVAEVDRCAGSQFDPDVAVAFLAAWESGAGVTAALRAAAAS